MAQVDLDTLRQLADKKLISTKKHPDFDLLIHNYTAVCQYEKAWDDHTTMCRGLITDLAGNIVARPFRKFFNLSEHEGGPSSTLPPVEWGRPFVAIEKLDGSLGVLYPTPDGLKIATRGSFTSPQAELGTAIWRQKYDAVGFATPTTLTCLFEILYPENRIVVDYGDRVDLVLLDLIDNESGLGLPWPRVEEVAALIGCPVAKRYSALEAEHDLRHFVTSGHQSTDLMDPKNSEGLVLRFDDGSRVKVKLDEYVRLHRLLTGVSARHVWECLSAGTSIDSLLESVPDEFYKWLSGIAGELRQKHADLTAEAYRAFAEVKERLPEDASRKDFALEFAKYEDHKGALFKALDGRDFSDLVWKRLRPEHVKAFKCGDDA